MRRTISAVLLALALLGANAPAATASTEPVEGASAAQLANCGGYTVVSANYLRLTNAAQTVTGSIQLCRHAAGSGYHYFARLQMYAPLPANHFANAFLYFYSRGTRYTFKSCDDSGEHVLPGRTMCYTEHDSNVRGDVHFKAVGREYRFNGHGWVLVSEGVTAVVG